MNFLKNNSELIQYENNEGENLLHLAAECQSLSSVAELVDAGVNVEKKSKKGWNPEDIACFPGEFRMKCYTKICMKMRKRLSNPRTPESVAAGTKMGSFRRFLYINIRNDPFVFPMC